MKKTRLVLMVLCCLFTQGWSGENLVPNGGFENAFKKPWGGGTFDQGPGLVECVAENPQQGQRCLRFYKERGPGGTQAMVRVPIALASRINVSWMHKGASGVCNLSFWNTDGGKTVATLSPLGKPATVTVKMQNDSGWTQYQKTIDIPDDYRFESSSFRFCFQLWGGNEPREFYLDQVSLEVIDSGQTGDAVRQEVNLAIPDLVREVDPAFSPMDFPVDVKIENGLLLRNGRPYYWIGNGCELGAGQSTPVGLWLAKLQNISFLTLGGKSEMSGKKEGDTILINQPRIEYGEQSWQREACRLGFFRRIPGGQGVFSWSWMRPLSEANPAFAEIHYDLGHYLCFDSNIPEGLRLLTLKRSAIYTPAAKMNPKWLCELNREPGPSPTNYRVLQDFRNYSKEKYGDLQTANTVWKKEYSDWDEIIPPHLDHAGMTDEEFAANKLALRRKVRIDNEEMYYDWIRFLQLDMTRSVKAEADDVRKLNPDAKITIDIRGHRIYSDSYCSYDPDLIDGLVDLFSIHYGYTPLEFNNTPQDLHTFANQAAYSLFNYNYFVTNSSQPVWDSENIVAKTTLPGSNEQAMAQNDIAQLHQSPWQFTIDDAKQGIDGKWFEPAFDDSAWATMTVPGCWDETKEYAGRSGWAWYRKRFIATNSNRQDYEDGSRRFYLYGKGIAQRGTIWFNGVKLGEVKGWAAEYKFDVSEILNYRGENQITVLVHGSGFKNGLRFYCHLLANDQINTAKPFSEKQYRAMYWTYMMRGASAISSWNWVPDILRPYMASIAEEVNSVSDIVLPRLRKPHGNVAYVYPYLWGRGLLAAAENTNMDHMSYYGALEFSGLRPDIYSEKNFLKLTPEKYPFAVLPYGKIVFPETYTHFKKYVEDGGTAFVTFGSLAKTFDRYRETDIETFCGVEILGENTQPKITIGEKDFAINEGDETHSRGVIISAVDANAVVCYPDGTPAVTEKNIGKGKVVFIAPRLDLYGVHALLKSYLPQPQIKITCKEEKEFAFIESALEGDDERKVLYLFNWGGFDRELTVRVPQQYAGWSARGVCGSFDRKSGDVFVVNVNAQTPAAILLEKPGVAPHALAKVSAEKQAVIDRVVKLNTPKKENRNVLFSKMFERQHTPVGHALYPYLMNGLDSLGQSFDEAPMNSWTPEYLNKFKLVVIDETWSPSYRGIFAKDSSFVGMMRKYVENGGSLMVMCHSAMTTNSSAEMIRKLTPVFGISLDRGLTHLPQAGAFGDPYQMVTDNIVAHPVTGQVKEVLLYTHTPLKLKEVASVTPLVLVPKSADVHAGAPVMAVAEYGNGRVFVSADIMAIQPYRIESVDNASLLINTLGWLLHQDVSPELRSRFSSDKLFGANDNHQKVME